MWPPPNRHQHDVTLDAFGRVALLIGHHDAVELASAPCTETPRRNLMPCLLKLRLACLLISRSAPGNTRSWYSSTVTLLPRRLQTDPSQGRSHRHR